MRLLNCVWAATLLLASPAWATPGPDDDSQVRAADAAFWRAYNACDMTAVADLLTAGVEFYHDKTGLTTSRDAVVASLRSGPCANPRMRLRREAVDESIVFHPLNGGYAILSGRHRFFVRDAGAPERLDGQAEFTTVWQLEGGHWRMHRVLSYGHGPVPYTPPPRTLTLAPHIVARYAGSYRSPHIGDIVVVADGDHLTLTAGTFVATLYPLSSTSFFALERELRFDFDLDANGAPTAISVFEHGAISEHAPRSK